MCGIQIQKQYMWNANTKNVEYKYKNSICGIQIQKQHMWNINT